MRKPTLSRREFLCAGAGALAGVVGLANAEEQHSSGPLEKRIFRGKRKRVLRAAHLTDIHIQPERQAEKWVARCLHAIQSLEDPPSVIFNTGDCIDDALDTPAQRVATLWKCWHRVWQNECSLPVEHCLGNHDVWGWGKKAQADRSDPHYGKAWAMEELRLTSRFRRVTKGCWHFVFLDSTFEVPPDQRKDDRPLYLGKLDDEQAQWLANELAKIPRGDYVCILSHIPILSACALFDGENERTGQWIIPKGWIHIDARQFKNLWIQHANVKVCLSGHLHLRERVEYNDVIYLCNGALSGNWWKGDYDKTPPGFCIIDFFDDGCITENYQSYGWQPVS